MERSELEREKLFDHKAVWRTKGSHVEHCFNSVNTVQLRVVAAANVVLRTMQYTLSHVPLYLTFAIAMLYAMKVAGAAANHRNTVRPLQHDCKGQCHFAVNFWVFCRRICNLLTRCRLGRRYGFVGRPRYD